MDRVVLFGLGGVGRCFLEMFLNLQQKREELSNTLAVVAVADSKHILVGQGPNGTPMLLKALNSDTLRDVIEAKSAGGKGLAHVRGLGFMTAEACQATSLLPQLVEEAKRDRTRPNDRFIFVDCTASTDGELYARVMALGCGVVYANKKPLAQSLEMFKRLTADRSRIRLESSIGAGMPFHATIRRLESSGDTITKISGHFSGSLSYVISGVEEGGYFSELVREARRRGLTEPDPRDDLSGRDVARKALILARWLGFELELKDLNVESILPPTFENLPLEVLMERLSELDEAVTRRVVDAASNGATLVYSAVVEKGSARVGFQEVSADDSMGRLDGVTNIVEIFSEVFSQDDPLRISGPGAGTRSTAAGILSDVVELALAKW